MAKAAIVVLAGTDTHADLGRVTNALQTVREFDEHGDEVELIFDGAGTTWIAELEGGDHKLAPLYQAVKDHVGVCDYCVGAFDVEKAVADSGVSRLSDYEGHPSIRSLVDDGYEIITF